MKCEHNWKRVSTVAIPLMFQTPMYECRKCKLQIESYVGPIEEIEKTLRTYEKIEK